MQAAEPVSAGIKTSTGIKTSRRTRRAIAQSEQRSREVWARAELQHGELYRGAVGEAAEQEEPEQEEPEQEAAEQEEPDKWRDTGYLLERYAAVLSLKVVARASGLSDSELSRRFRAVDADYSAVSRCWAEERKRAFVEYVKNGSLRKTAAQAGFGHVWVGEWFKAMHPQYAAISRSGVFAASADFITGWRGRRNPDRATEIENWLCAELPDLIKVEAVSVLSESRPAYRVKRERTFRRRELPLLEEHRGRDHSGR